MHSVSEMRKSCENIDTTKLSEDEEIALIMRRQKVAKMWKVEVCLRRMFDLGDDVEKINDLAEVMAQYRKCWDTVTIYVIMSKNCNTCISHSQLRDFHQSM